MSVIIYGAGFSGRRILKEISQTEQVLAFADSDPGLWGTEISGIKVISPDEISGYEFSRIVIATVMAFEEISDKLISDFLIPRSRIDISYVEKTTKARDSFLASYAKIVYENRLDGSIAEGGVCEGIFAKKMNALFPDRTLYLFDTFEGFDVRDVCIEKTNGFSESKIGHLKLSTEEQVLNNLPYPKRVIIKKGYFPETAKDINDTFVFVNLDFDLYNPTLSGLEFFYPKMVHGGVILIHDYFNACFQGVKQALCEFCSKYNLAYMPIADELSVAIIKC